MKIGHRTCIICLPRSGSQLAERLAGELHDGFSLGEYFEQWDQSEYKLDSDNNVFLDKFTAIPASFAINENFQKRLDLLKLVNKDQPLTMRIFLMDHYNKDTMLKILSELDSIGFEFITLFRDLREQLLSFMIAYTYQYSRNEMVFDINSAIEEPVTIDLGLPLRRALAQIKNSSTNWDKNLSIVLNNKKSIPILYKTIQKDMENIYNTTFNYSGVKSIKSDPLNLILNKTEVLGFLDN